MNESLNKIDGPRATHRDSPRKCRPIIFGHWALAHSHQRSIARTCHFIERLCAVVLGSMYGVYIVILDTSCTIPSTGRGGARGLW